MSFNVTLKSLAEILNVSISTVSKSLNDSPDIGHDTKIMVKKLAKELGYIKNSNALNLKNKTTQLIGIILPGLSSTFCVHLLEEIERQTRTGRFHLILKFSQGTIDSEESCILELIEMQVDGIILLPCDQAFNLESFSHINTINNYHIPLVILDEFIDSIDCDQISIDHSSALESAIHELSDFGKEKILLILEKGGKWHKRYQEQVYFSGLQNKSLITLIFNDQTDVLQNLLINKYLDHSFNGIICPVENLAIACENVIRNNMAFPKNLKILSFGVNRINLQLPFLNYIDKQPTVQAKLSFKVICDRINSAIPENKLRILVEPRAIGENNLAS